MEVKIISKDSIKPSVPTPQNRKDFNISFLDQFAPCSYIPVILFYNTNVIDNDDDDDHFMINNKEHVLSELLKKSLSETLTLYYPLAGRLKDVSYIDCNDKGVLYMEAKANFHLSKFLENPNIPFLNKFLPCNGNCLEHSSQPLLALQVTTFECGRIAIGVCMLHKIVDASVMSAFLKTWAKLTRSSTTMTTKPQSEISWGSLYESSDVITPSSTCPIEKDLYPDFTSAVSLFPPIEPLPSKFISDFENFYFQGSKSPMRRYLFDSKAIATLKANTSSQSVPFPSRVEALTALVCKRIAEASKSLSDSPKTLMITHAANLRTRVEPPLAQNAFGNLLWIAFAFYDPSDPSIGLPELTTMLREVFAELNPENVEGLDSEAAFAALSDVLESLSTNENIKIYRFTSWCNLGLYDVDYGWGKPVWVAHMGDLNAGHVRTKHQFVFLESGSDDKGIELWIASDDEEIRVLEKDPEFLAYAKPNPRISMN